MKKLCRAASGSWISPCALMAAVALLAGCSPTSSPSPKSADGFDHSYQKVMIQKLIDAKPGEVIDIPEGRYAFDRGLVLRVDGVTLRGAGMARTILSFKGQTSGAEGLLVDGDDFTIEDLAIEDSKGDGLKIVDSRRIAIRNVRVEWTRGPDTDNGAYGLYPVQSEDVLIEHCLVVGASDAGIYVGQSRDIVIRHNRAERNVAGIEVENSVGADVHDNIVTGNTGGILVFNMPNLPLPGHTTRVYSNSIVANNHENFARDGTAVASVPAGSGVIINSNDKVEIFDNEFKDNRTANVIVSSYWSTGYMNKYGVSKTYDPYPEEIHVHSNRYSGGGDSPDGVELKALKMMMFGINGRFPDVLWDGYANPDRVAGPQICVDDGAAQVLNADGPGKHKRPSVMDASEVKCVLPRLPAAVVESPGTSGSGKTSGEQAALTSKAASAGA